MVRASRSKSSMKFRKWRWPVGICLVLLASYGVWVLGCEHREDASAASKPASATQATAATYRHIDIKSLYDRRISHDNDRPVDSDVPSDLRALNGVKVALQAYVLVGWGAKEGEEWLWLAPSAFPVPYPPGMVHLDVPTIDEDRFKEKHVRVYGTLTVAIRPLRASYYYVYSIKADKVEIVGPTDVWSVNPAKPPEQKTGREANRIAIGSLIWAESAPLVW